MNYTQTKSSVIFELPLSDYFEKSRRYNRETKRHDQVFINSIQDYEESLFDNFESFYPYIDLKDYSQYYSLEDAEKYLVSKGYTQAEIDLHRATLERDQVRALADAKDDSYQYEYSQKYYKMIMEAIREDISNVLAGYDYKILDDLTDKDFQAQKTDQEFIRLEISKKDVKRYLKENYPAEKWENNADYSDYFADYALDYSPSKIDTDYIDSYGTLGSCDDWLTYFKDYNNIEAEIDNYRNDEASKLNNLERASLELKTNLDNINDYINKYIDKEPEKTKITRQIKALKSVIKNAA